MLRTGKSYQLPKDEKPCKRSLAEIAQALSVAAFTPVSLPLDKPRTVWVATIQVHVPKLEGKRWIAIQLNASTCLAATDIDYFLTNASDEQVTAEWMAQTYSQRNWVEVFYRQAKGWFGLSEYQVRDAKSMKRHWMSGVHGLHLHSLASTHRWGATTLGNQALADYH